MAWSWILAAIGILGLYLAGRKSAWGWAIGLGAQILWIVYAVDTEQDGFLVSACAYGAVYLKNFRKWRKDEFRLDLGDTDSPGNSVRGIRSEK